MKELRVLGKDSFIPSSPGPNTGLVTQKSQKIISGSGGGAGVKEPGLMWESPEFLSQHFPEHTENGTPVVWAADTRSGSRHEDPTEGAPLFLMEKINKV